MEKKYQIFISSTYKDLIEARSKVRDAILSMMHFPVGMEMFNAADEEQWEIIQETIDSSDYYVLILGQRYGSVIESGSDAGISYTEKEFRYAREKKIPILVFIIDDDVAIKPEFMEKDPESIKKLADFKTEAKKGRTVQWWTNIDELAREVSESLHQQMDRKKRPGWIRGDAFDIEASHAEILSLNKKIRELEQENAELKSQIVKRVPELMAAVVLDQQEDEEEDEKGLKTHGKLLIDSSDNEYKIQLYHNDGECYKNKYEPLDLSCVESHLKKYVKEKDLQAYNAALPSEEEINDYYRKSGIRIIENSDSIQCVKKNGTTGVVFLKDKTHSAGGISCDRRCIVMTTQTCGTLELSISDITQKQDKIYIELDYSAQEIISKSERINIIQLVPYVCMEIDTCAARGEEQHIKFGGVKNV